MSTNTVLETRTGITNLPDLIDALQELTSHIGCFHRDTIVVFGKDGGSLRVRLIEDRLSDGSIVTNVSIE